MLPKEMLVPKAKTGEIDTSLWVAIEDLHDGLEKSGEVGQDVYGAGIAFGVIPKQCFKVPGESLVVFCDYPVQSFKVNKGIINVKVNGDLRLSCSLILLLENKTAKYQCIVTDAETDAELKPLKTNLHMNLV